MKLQQDYVTASPETIASLITTGKFPIRLPNWVHPTKIIFFKQYDPLHHSSHTNIHQTFIVEIRTHLSVVNYTAFKKKTFDEQCVDPDAINRIIVYSERGKKLLQNLIKDQGCMPITIHPDFFNQATQADETTLPNLTARNLTPKRERNDNNITSSHDTGNQGTYVAITKKLKITLILTLKHYMKIKTKISCRMLK